MWRPLLFWFNILVHLVAICFGSCLATISEYFINLLKQFWMTPNYNWPSSFLPATVISTELPKVREVKHFHFISIPIALSVSSLRLTTFCLWIKAKWIWHWIKMFKLNSAAQRIANLWKTQTIEIKKSVKKNLRDPKEFWAPISTTLSLSVV